MPCWPASSCDLSRTLLFAEVDDWLDDERRPIGEIRASETVRRATGASYIRCPYSGSRAGVPRLVNFSALNQTLTHWAAARAILAFARRATGLKDGEPAPLYLLARAAAFAQILPAFIGFANPGLHAVPAGYAVAHKMAAGLFGLAKNRLIAIGISGRDPLEAHETARSLHRFAERSGALLSRTGLEACAGPAAQIADALRILTGEKRDTSALQEEFSILPDERNFALYADAVLGLHLWLGAFVTECHLAGVVESKAISNALPIARPLFELPNESMASYGRGCVTFLRRLHADKGSVSNWCSHWNSNEAFDGRGIAVFNTLQAAVHSAFSSLPSGIGIDGLRLRDWCALRMPNSLLGDLR